MTDAREHRAAKNRSSLDLKRREFLKRVRDARSRSGDR